MKTETVHAHSTSHTITYQLNQVNDEWVMTTIQHLYIEFDEHTSWKYRGLITIRFQYTDLSSSQSFTTGRWIDLLPLSSAKYHQSLSVESGKLSIIILCFCLITIDSNPPSFSSISNKWRHSPARSLISFTVLILTKVFVTLPIANCHLYSSTDVVRWKAVKFWPLDGASVTIQKNRLHGVDSGGYEKQNLIY